VKFEVLSLDDKYRVYSPAKLCFATSRDEDSIWTLLTDIGFRLIDIFPEDLLIRAEITLESRNLPVTSFTMRGVLKVKRYGDRDSIVNFLYSAIHIARDLFGEDEVVNVVFEAKPL